MYIKGYLGTYEEITKQLRISIYYQSVNKIFLVCIDFMSLQISFHNRIILFFYAYHTSRIIHDKNTFKASLV